MHHFYANRSLAAIATVAFVAALSLAWPAGHASAASLNQQSDQSALRAYETYLRSLVSAAPTATADDTKYIANVNGGCHGALTQETEDAATSSALNTVLINVGFETAGDLAVKYLTVAHKPFKRLSAKLSGLSWTSKAAATTVGQFLRAERAVLAITASHLCADVFLIAPSTTTTPAGTKTFDQQYDTATSQLKTALAGLLTLLERYEIAADKATVKKINTLATDYNKLWGASQTISTNTLETDLGVPPTAS